jgi:WhiB family redox-sensing transcriptional regulator
MKEANCLGEDGDLFFPPHEPIAGRPPGKGVYDKARAICSECSQITPCLRYAMVNDIDHGMWGGYTPAERRKLRRKLRKGQHGR